MYYDLIICSLICVRVCAHACVSLCECIAHAGEHPQGPEEGIKFLVATFQKVVRCSTWVLGTELGSFR